MSVEAKIIQDSVSAGKVRLSTFQLKYPRVIHAELLTHRLFSRNSSSSRAIPVAKLIDQAINDPAVPEYWGKNQAGMQAAEELEGDALEYVKALWFRARNYAVDMAREMAKWGAHKQTINRLLEPFTHISVVLTATEWDNWFELRDHKDAEPHIAKLARLMRKAMAESEPAFRTTDAAWPSSWHLPYISQEERTGRPALVLAKMSVARCARVSYLRHDGQTPSEADDLTLFDRLVGSKPLHASPTEHQAVPMSSCTSSFCKNFKGWQQFRYFLEKGMLPIRVFARDLKT